MALVTIKIERPVLAAAETRKSRGHRRKMAIAAAGTVADNGQVHQPPPDQPDYRMSLAAERTYLAYVRTGLALTASGVAVAGALPHAGAEMLRRVLGLVLVLVGAAVFGIGRLRWSKVTRAMQRGEPLPAAPMLFVVAVLLVVIALAAGAVVLMV